MILKIVCLIVIGALFALLIFSIDPISWGNAEGAIGFPSYWEYDTNLVSQIQSRLNYWNNADLTVDGKFGPATAKAVKDYQSKEGLTASGVVDDATAERLQATGWPSGTTMYYMANLEAIRSKSTCEYLLYVSLGGRARTSHISIFHNGTLVAETACSTANESNGYYTNAGVFTVYRKSVRRELFGDDRFMWYNQTWLVPEKLSGSDVQTLEANMFAIESECYKLETLDIIPGQQMGTHETEGNICVPLDLSAWIMENIPVGATVAIDDRNYQPSSIGFEDFIFSMPWNVEMNKQYNYLPLH